MAKAQLPRRLMPVCEDATALNNRTRYYLATLLPKKRRGVPSKERLIIEQAIDDLQTQLQLLHTIRRGGENV